MSFQKSVFVTGAARGIGKHLSSCFHEKGYFVWLADIVISELEAYAESWDSDSFEIVSLDVSNKSNWELLEKKLQNSFHTPQIWINNAGVVSPNYISDITFQSIDYQIDVNLKGVMYGTKVASNILKKTGNGHIINIASLAGVAPINGLSEYSASKFGVRAFSLSLVEDLKKLGILISVICPDLVNTQMLTDQLTNQAAALTFSGTHVLNVSDIETAVFDKALGKKKIEILVPNSRGLLAKIGNFSPTLTTWLTEMLTKKGNKRRLALQGKNDSNKE
jgi:3-oxoacyl-[acyl-carrier protein] reductase